MGGAGADADIIFGDTDRGDADDRRSSRGGGSGGSAEDFVTLSRTRRTNAISKVLSLIEEQRLLMRFQAAAVAKVSKVGGGGDADGGAGDGSDGGAPTRRAKTEGTLVEEEGKLARAITVAQNAKIFVLSAGSDNRAYPEFVLCLQKVAR